MKKFLIPIVIGGFIIVMLVGEMMISSIISLASAEENQEVMIEDISSKLIRFHVIANSDGELDQKLKLKVRDEVLKYIQPLLKDSKDIEESRDILKEENENIINIAKETIEENGYSYKVESTLTKEYFPVKTYGNITLPQGKYEAYRIIIGSGEGQNWWCVMFPPICFVDLTKGEVAYEETENQMKKVLNDKELNLVSNTKEASKDNLQGSKVVDNTEDNNIVIKFKIGELLKNLFK